MSEEKKIPVNKVTGRHFINKTGVVSIDGVKTKEESIREQGLLELTHSKATRTPLTMRMAGVEPFVDDVRVAIGFFKDWKVIISPEEFFPDETIAGLLDFTMDSAARRGDNKLAAFYRALSMYNGAEVDFIPKEIYEDEGIVIASRKEAMDIIKKDMWQAINFIREKDPDTGEIVEKEEYLLKEETVVTARVVGVTLHYATLEIFGMEVRVFLPNLSYTRTDNAKRLFETGEVIRAVLTEVKRGEDGRVKSIGVSVRLANRNPQEITYENVVEYGRYRGTVSYIKGYSADGKLPVVYVVLKNIGGGTVYCRLPENIIPQIGEEVEIVILRKYPNNHGIVGKILHVYKSEF